MSSKLLLSNSRVIDLTQVFAGPYCTYQLALLGAQVIKIEPPGGEMARLGGGILELAAQRLGLSFCTQNADKYCLEMDLKDPAQVAKVLELAASADVFVQSLCAKFPPRGCSTFRFGRSRVLVSLIYGSMIFDEVSGRRPPSAVRRRGYREFPCNALFPACPIEYSNGFGLTLAQHYRVDLILFELSQSRNRA